MAPNQKFRAALAKAEEGDPQAQAFVFFCYYAGKEGVTKDVKLAFKFCRMAAEGGDTESQFDLAGFYALGEGVERDKRKAWFLRAAKEGGHSEAQYRTAQRYRTGNGHDAPNLKEAAKWYQAAVAQGHAGAEFNLAGCYNQGDGVPKNPGLALKLWRICAKHHETGDDAKYIDCVAAAHYNNRSSYYFGLNGVEKDLTMAMQCWMKAAELGNKTAQCAIGEIYLTGFEEDVPVGTFDRDVPLGLKQLRAVTVAEQKSDEDAALIANAEALLRDFRAVKSCMGCASPKARKLCGGSYCAPTCGGCVDAGQAKARYCGKACQVIHWRHPTASHKAECASRAATRDGSSGAA
jgi:TPR repeat protein